MGYRYRNMFGDMLLITRDDDGHLQLIVTNRANGGAGQSALICIPAGDVPPVLREMAAWAELRGLAEDIGAVGAKPVEVTSDRLGDHYAAYYDRLSGSELETLSKARMILERIAEEDG